MCASLPVKCEYVAGFLSLLCYAIHIKPMLRSKNSTGPETASGVLSYSLCAATKQNDFPSLFSNIEDCLKPPGEKIQHSLCGHLDLLQYQPLC